MTNKNDIFTALIERMSAASLAAFSRALVERERTLAGSDVQRALISMSLAILPEADEIARDAQSFRTMLRAMINDCLFAAALRLRASQPGDMVAGLADWGAEVAALALEHAEPAAGSN
jgi:hypothetical protein